MSKETELTGSPQQIGESAAECMQCGAPLKDGKCSVQPWHAAEAPRKPSADSLRLLVASRDALLHADSMLSLIRHRGGIQTWGTTGMPQEYEADAVIGETRRAYEALLRFLSGPAELRESRQPK